jgi:glycosyltransferase involved in cell wall biosynthesis
MIEFNVVIATYNSAATLERCLESVRAISPAVSCNVVLIDGASTDNTLEIAEKYSDILNIVVSEPDCGIYDAWNKGLTYCTHRWVMFLGSDDYICPTAFLDYVTFIQRLVLFVRLVGHGTGDCSGNTCAPCTRAASLLWTISNESGISTVR